MNPLKNWKTSLLGIAAGVLQLVASGASPKQAVSAVAIAALGVFAHDADTSNAAKQ